jgi:hypothetical protein
MQDNDKWVDIALNVTAFVVGFAIGCLIIYLLQWAGWF